LTRLSRGLGKKKGANMKTKAKKDRVSDLSKKKNTSVKAKIDVLPKVLRECEIYLREYQTGEGTALSLIQSLIMAETVIRETRHALIKAHNLEHLSDWIEP
jgi:hypothetical protein